MKPLLLPFRLLLVSLAFSLAALLNAAGAEPVRREWTVDDVSREALVSAPATTSTDAAPLVFVFHGHGGTMQNAARSFRIHTLWPEALVVYPQGLNTPGRLSDPEGKKPGWQHSIGAQGDRDLNFFDAMLETLQKDYRVDPRRVYSTGHSNGGGFTYLLWAARGDRLAAVAPSASAAPGLIGKLKPKPVMHLAGEKDPLVKFAWQQQTLSAVCALNQCGEGQPWSPLSTLYPSKIGAPVVTFIHPGGHQFVPEAPALIVKFFREQAKP